VELGPGKGGFICEIAKQNPDVLYVGIEKVPDVLVMAMERALTEDVKNVRFIRGMRRF
jgi:tRNA (guanine-N7-)-methyltransferase